MIEFYYRRLYCRNIFHYINDNFQVLNWLNIIIYIVVIVFVLLSLKDITFILKFLFFKINGVDGLHFIGH